MVACFLVALTCSPGLLMTGGDDPPALEKERRRFVGAWELTEVVRDGEKQPEPLGGKTIYHFAAEGTYVGKVGTSVVGKGTYRPIPGSTPAAVDWTAAGRNEFDGSFTKEYPSVGIYRIEDETLTVVLKFQGKAEERPKEIDCKPGSGHTLLRLKRVK
jgi:uncharacterized protein (TIGR03067 family)